MIGGASAEWWQKNNNSNTYNLSNQPHHPHPNIARVFFPYFVWSHSFNSAPWSSSFAWRLPLVVSSACSAFILLLSPIWIFFHIIPTDTDKSRYHKFIYEGRIAAAASRFCLSLNYQEVEEWRFEIISRTRCKAPLNWHWEWSNVRLFVSLFQLSRSNAARPCGVRHEWVSRLILSFELCNRIAHLWDPKFS